MKKERMVRGNTWILNPRATEKEIQRYGETLRRISNSLGRIRFSATGDQLRDEAGALSVEMRKLLIDGGRFMERRIIERARFKRLARKFPIEGGASVMRAQGTIGGQSHNSYYEWHSLPGCAVHNPGLNWWKFYSAIFEEAGSSMMGIDQWLKQKIVGIWSIYEDGGRKYKGLSLGQILKYIVNKEGAHVEITRDPKEMDKDFLCLVGDQDKFSYLHWIVICMAIYLYNRQHISALARPDVWQKYLENGVITLLDDTISINAEPSFVPLMVPTQANESIRLVTPATGLGSFVLAKWEHPGAAYGRYDRTGSVRE